MLGSTSEVIPPAGNDDAPAASGAPANGAAKRTDAATPAASGALDLATFVDRQLRPAARQKSVKLDGLLNGACHAVSWQDGVLTLGFFEDKFHKKGVEDAQNRRVYEELAAEILGAPVSIRCIVAPRPAKALSKSPLVQHAVENHGAKIVSEDQEL